MELRLEPVFARLRAAAHDTREPLCAYVYDLEGLRRHAARTVAALPSGCQLFYAIKANSELPVLRTLAPLVHGFEVSSGGELEWVRAHFPDTPVIFSGPGKLDAELEAALALGVECIHVESLHELRRLGALAAASGRVASILLRMNIAPEGLPQTRLMMGGKPTPFGIPADELEACLAWLRGQPSLRLRGFHFHLLSHQLDAEAHVKLVGGYLAQVREWCRRHDLQVEQVNVGGGIGVNYVEPERQFDWPGFCAGLAALPARAGLPEVSVRFEIGRYLTAACGYYAMQVVDIKRSHGKTFVVGRGGTHHFRTPAAQGHSHPFHVLPVDAWPYPFARPAVRDAMVNVVGQLCTPKDVLAFDAQVDTLRCHDLLVFTHAGAYAWHISHHDFLRHAHPAQWYLDAEDESSKVS